MEDSKAQKKREADELRKTAVKLTELGREKLEKLPLPANLLKAIVDAKSIKSHGAKRRQILLVANLIRAAGAEDILAAYEQLLAEDSAQTFAFHEVEQWRERLLANEKDALTDFISKYQPDNIQEFRQLVKKALVEQNKGTNQGAAKALFRFLRSFIS